MYLLSSPCLLDRTYVVTTFVLSICLLYSIAARIVPLHIYLICVVVSFLVESDAGVVVIEPENVVFQHCTHLTFFSNACSPALGVGAPTSGREKGAFLKSFMVILLPMDCAVVRSLEHRHLFQRAESAQLELGGTEAWNQDFQVRSRNRMKEVVECSSAQTNCIGKGALTYRTPSRGTAETGT
jgi:hypothetical protein